MIRAPLLFLLILILTIPAMVLGSHSHSNSTKPKPTPTPEATDDAPTPTPTPSPLPAMHGPLTYVAFEKHEAGVEKKKIVVLMGYELLRLEMPDDRLNVIYNTKTETYLGLEVSNATWWTFCWPKVEDAVKRSKRYDSRSEELSLNGLDAYLPPTPTPVPTPTPLPTLPPVDMSLPGTTTSTATAPTPSPAPGPSIPDSLAPPPAAPDTSSSSSGLPDAATYIWTPTEKKKKVSGLLCVLWTGTNPSGDTLRAWCIDKPVPDISEAMEKMREVNEPMALVPIHELVPPTVFLIYDQLQKSGMLPIEVDWGPTRSESTFRCLEVKEEKYSDKLFSIPKTFRKTTLVTMDGIYQEQ